MSDPNNKTNIPLGLNINDFMPGSQQSNNNAPSGQRSNVPESKDPPIINDIFKNAPNFKLLMKTRIKNLTNAS